LQAESGAVETFSFVASRDLLKTFDAVDSPAWNGNCYTHPVREIRLLRSTAVYVK